MRIWSLLARAFVAIVLAAALLDCSVAPPPAKAPMPAGATWGGKWDTTWGPLDLTQSGTRVTGSYSYKSVHGTLTGSMDQNYLQFDWNESEGGAGSGKGLFVMGADGRSFSGTWGQGASDSSGGSWSGTRIGEAPAIATGTPAQPASTPAPATTGGAPAGVATAATSDGVATCGRDENCPSSTYCKNGRCTAECTQDAQCSADKRCDGGRGRCVPR